MTSITNYSLIDGLPKDVAGNKFQAWVRIESSALGFALPRAIGASVKSASQVVQSAHLGVATHTEGSAVNGTNVGLLAMGILAPSVIPAASTFGNAKAYGAGITPHRELFSAPRPALASLITAGSLNQVGLSPIHSMVFI